MRILMSEKKSEKEKLKFFNPRLGGQKIQFESSITIGLTKNVRKIRKRKIERILQQSNE